MSVENGSERLGVPPSLVTDYLALVGDTSDNIPGVKGIGEKTAQELVNTYGTVENILAHAAELTKKRPREALLEQREMALLSKELVTIRQDLPVTLDLEAMRLSPPDFGRLRTLYVELEFTAFAKSAAMSAAEHGQSETPAAAASEPAPPRETKYTTVNTVAALEKVVARARRAPYIAIDVETVADPTALREVDPLRSPLVGLTIAVAPGEAYYFPLAHRERADDTQGDLELFADMAPAEPEPKKARAKKVSEPTSIAARALAAGEPVLKNLPPLDSPEMAPLKALLEDASVKKAAQNAKDATLVLRVAGINVQGLEFDTMVASYVLDPGRRSHGLDLLALEFLDHKLTTFEELCGKGKTLIPFDQVPIECARDYSCEDADMTWQLRERFEPQLDGLELARLFHDVEMPLVQVLAEMEWTGITIDVDWFASLKVRFERERKRVEQEIYAVAGQEFNINSNPQLREILFDKLNLPVLKKTSTGASTDASVLQQLAEEGHQLPVLLMEYRELAKLESTYIDALPAYVHPQNGPAAYVAEPNRRSDRSSFVERPEPPEHPHSPRAGSRHSAWLHSAEGLDAPCRRLLADRAASARAPLGRPGLRPGVSVRRRHPPADRGADLRRAARAGQLRDARTRKDDQLRDDLRSGRARAVAPAQDRALRGKGVHREILPALFPAFASISTRWSSSRASTDTSKPSSIAGAISTSFGTATSIFARSGSVRRRIRQSRGRPPI